MISNVQVSNVKRRSVTITWTTDEASTTTVEYGKTAAYGKTRTGTTGVLHSVTLTRLRANTLYHYHVESEDAAVNIATSADSTFKTKR